MVAGAGPRDKGGDAGRLGVYVDAAYAVVDTPSGRRVSTDRSFLLFVCEVGASFDSLVLFGRARPAQEDSEYIMPLGVEFVPLPHYSNLRQFGEVFRATAGTLVGFWRGLRRVDTVWVFGPHPFAVSLAVMAILRRKRVVLGVRQHSVRLYKTRLVGWPRIPGLVAVSVVEYLYRVLARHVPVTVLGEELRERYGGERPALLVMTVSIVRDGDVVPQPAPRDWDGVIQLLTVGRLEPEKNPGLLVRAMAQLERDRPGRYRLDWVGRGPLEERVFELASELGIEERIEFRGYVPFDQGLLDLYRRAHAFVHVSLSEGMPQVVIEALASGTPIVATDVGGVRAAVENGRAALLVPPDDLGALVAALLRVSDDPALRERLTADGLALARGMTLEVEAARVLRFIRSHTTSVRG
jgi:glycosyltransferase involved in cell wall biosynthesis